MAVLRLLSNMKFLWELGMRIWIIIISPLIARLAFSFCLFQFLDNCLGTVEFAENQPHMFLLPAINI